ncbi:MAG: DUF167 domain-containing protein [Nanoarchaeota archaeon]|nr:DUF167 domain-containing protein [Nanoarchaeota archaeon]
MKINVRVHSNSSQEKIVTSDDGCLDVWLKSAPKEGKANAELLKMLRKYFKKEVMIKSGMKSRNKVVEVLG